MPGRILTLSIRSPVKHRRLHIAAWLALAAFVAGGLVGPVVHHAAHGIEHARHAEDAAAQTEHVHAAGTVFTVALDGVPLGHDLCLLCPPQHKDAPPAPAGSAVYAADESFGVEAPGVPAAAHGVRHLIRGPPAVA